MSLSEEQVRALKGLFEKEVALKLKQDGYNELPSAKKRGFFKIVFEVMKEPMFLLLVACGVLYFILGDIQEAVMLVGFVVVIIGITVYQEGKTEKAIDALKDLSSPRALVIREGEQKRIPGREVVTGDIIILAEGDRVPADCVVLWEINLTADESLLTGESMPVGKKATNHPDSAMGRPGGEDIPFVYSGTMIIQGQAVALVKGVGGKTEMGKIGKALESVVTENTLLQKETGKLVANIFIIAVLLSVAVVVVYGLTRGDWLKGVLSGITLAMAMLPEEFPVVLTVFLALGAWRISKKNVLTRKIAAVETLGAATVLCVDKTGTLTQNRMTIRKLYAKGKFHTVDLAKHDPLPEFVHELVEYGILASKKDPFDPMDKALKNLGEVKLSNTEHLHDNWKLVQEYPLSRELLALSNVWESHDGKNYIISAKGAPEAIADLCHFDKEQMDQLTDRVVELAKDGYRVLGVAKSYFKQTKDLPDIQHDFAFEFIGLIGLEDPIRPTVPRSIAESYGAGIRVVMITGDYPQTAQNIARQIGLANIDEVVTGPELDKMAPEELREKVKHVNIFSRVVPEQKLLLVNALKDNGEVVAMTGDGVNDAPALKSAHIGVAMGERGTDVAREASDLVLTDDAFSSIVDAVRIGRRIFDNLKKAMAYIVSVHIPIAGMSLIPVVLRWDNIVLYPVHIVFLELIIDPACSVVFEAEKEEKDIMNRKPRKPNEPLFGKRSLTISVLQGLISLLTVYLVYQLAIYFKQTPAEARTLTFITLIISNLSLILTNRSWYRTIFSMMKVRNNALIGVLLGATGFLLLVIYVPFLRDLFHFAFMHPRDIAIAFAAGLFSIFWFEIAKTIFRKMKIDIIKEKK